MDKSGCSLSKGATVEELKVGQDEFVGDKAVINKELVGFQSDQSNCKDKLISKATGLSSSVIFPEEVWEVILNAVVNSEDIHNVLLAFPELDKAFQRRKAFWLFGEVLPHLMTKYLVAKKFKDVFTLRLVSKRWKASVDSSLRRHVDLQHLPPPALSLNDSEEDPRKLLPSENHFNYLRPQESRFGASIFRTGHQIDNFLTAMATHSGNPFPGNYVAVKVSSSSTLSALTLFEKFGEQVQFLEIELDGNPECHFQLCRIILKCLSHLPHLQSLTFTGKLLASADQQTSSFFSKLEANNLFPILPNLEAFTWQLEFEGDDYDPLMSMWITRMIQKYGRKDGLRKLGISSDLFWYVSSSLPSLTELELIDVPGCDKTEYEFVKYALASLSNPLQLRKLCLQDVNWSYIGRTKLINFLAEFKVESLILRDVVSSQYEKNEGEVGAAATSISSLYLTDDFALSYDFFKWLPNLQFLTIHFKWDEGWGTGRRNYFEGGIKPGDSLAKRIRGFVLKACDKSVEEIKGIEEFSIWMELPKLQMLSVKVTTQRSRGGDGGRGKEDSVWDLQFVRECGDKAFFSSKPDGVRLVQDDDDEDNGWSDNSDWSD